MLRLDRRTGDPWPGNPFIGADNAKKRYVYTYGHRNVQGLAQRRDGTIWSAEHGPDVDDEVNLVRAGGDYGWNPVPGYNESVPMTDQSLPGDQVDARWSSGRPTVATSGSVWVYGKKWGSLNGTLAVAALKANRIIFLKFDADGTFVRARSPQALQQFGRLRSLTRAANGDLLATTDNGSRRRRAADHSLAVATDSDRSVLPVVVVPRGVVVPGVVALLDLLQGTGGVLGGRVRTQPVLVAAPVLTLDGVMGQAEPVLLLGLAHAPKLPGAAAGLLSCRFPRLGGDSGTSWGTRSPRSAREADPV